VDPPALAVSPVCQQKSDGIFGSCQKLRTLFNTVVQRGKGPHRPGLRPDELIAEGHSPVVVETGKNPTVFPVDPVFQPKWNEGVEQQMTILVIEFSMIQSEYFLIKIHESIPTLLARPPNRKHPVEPSSNRFHYHFASTPGERMSASARPVRLVAVLNAFALSFGPKVAPSLRSPYDLPFAGVTMNASNRWTAFAIRGSRSE